MGSPGYDMEGYIYIYATGTEPSEHRESFIGSHVCIHPRSDCDPLRRHYELYIHDEKTFNGDIPDSHTYGYIWEQLSGNSGS